MSTIKETKMATSLSNDKFLMKENINHIKINIYLTLDQIYQRRLVNDAYCVQKSNDSRILQFALLITVCCVLPRYENQDIRR